MNAVHFGAGKIGRGFVGLLLSRSGFNVCFVARNEKQIALLQRRKQYTVKLANETGDTAVVENVTAININNSTEVEHKIAGADIVTTAVGVSSLKHIAEAIAKGITVRLQNNPGPLQVIACENAVGGSSLLKKWVYFYLNPEWHDLADRYISFPNTMVDRIVPNQQHADPLTVKVEPFYEWVIQRSGGMNGMKKIKGVQYVDSLEPYVERKLFTVNTGHCCAAYFGYLEGHKTIQEVMKNPLLKRKVLQVLQETGDMLVKKHSLDGGSHREYINKTLDRFANPRLTDKVIRVGRSPIRKLSFNDRLVRPLLQACKLNTGYSYLVSAISAALLFDYEKDPEAVKLQMAIRRKGIHQVISSYMGIPEEHPVHQQIVKKYEKYKQKFRAHTGNESCGMWTS